MARAKFISVKIMPCLTEIMRQNTAFYQSDIDTDAAFIAKAAASDVPEDRRLLWMSRECGTECHYERDVFLEGTAAHNTWMYHAATESERHLAYFVNVTGTDADGGAIGSIYELDFEKLADRILKNSSKASKARLIYENGETEEDVAGWRYGGPDGRLGKLVSFRAVPDDPDRLREALDEERWLRAYNKESDFAAHVRKLHRQLLKCEAERLEKALRNKPAGASAEIDRGVVRLAGTKEIRAMARGLKCGASLEERDGRLYAVKAGAPAKEA